MHSYRISRTVHWSRVVLGLAALAALTLAGSAQAGPILFNFNSLKAGVNSSSGADAIDSYMTGVYGSTVKVGLGGKTQKNKPDSHDLNNWLGRSDGATSNSDMAHNHADPLDTYLINRFPTYDRFAITFVDKPIFAAEFDWQIFAQLIGSPTVDATSDIKVYADGVLVYYQNIPIPPVGSFYDNTGNPWVSGTKYIKVNGLLYQYGGASNPFANLPAGSKPWEQGLIGHASLTFTGPVHVLEFVDWHDAPIGIDNLAVCPAPAPASIVSLGIGMGLAGLARWRRGRNPV